MMRHTVLVVAAVGSLIACSGSVLPLEEGEAGAPGTGGQVIHTGGRVGSGGGIAVGGGPSVGGGPGAGGSVVIGGGPGVGGGVVVGGGPGVGGSIGVGGGPGTGGQQPCAIPEYSENCAEVPYFQCGFEAHCEGNVIVASWHEHVMCGEDAYDELIAEFSCSFPCSVSCAEDAIGWPRLGTGLVADACSEDVGGPRRVFVTSEVFTGNFGSLGDADAQCQRLATAARQPGIYKAWLSDALNSPSSRFTHSDEGYVLVPGDWLARSWNELIINGPTYAINVDEHGELVPDGSMVWTGTGYDGLGVAETCDGWTSLDTVGGAGDTSSASDWTLATPMTCSSTARLYCFQQ